MKTVINNRINIFIISVLIVLSVFVMGINADSIFADDGTGTGAGTEIGTDTDTETEESTWLASGYLGDEQGVPWHVTPDWELVIGEEGKVCSYTHGWSYHYGSEFPWHTVGIEIDSTTTVATYHYIKKARFVGTVNLNGDCSNLFNECLRLEEVDLSGLDTSGITNMTCMFRGCKKLKQIDISGFDTHNVTSIAGMFSDCSLLKTLDLSCFSDAENLQDISYLFRNCTNLVSIDLSMINTTNVYNMEELFNGCTSLQNVNLSGIDTSNVRLMNNMFHNCKALGSVDISGFDTSALQVKDEFHRSGSKDMFANAFMNEIALGSSTFPSDTGLTAWITRERTLSGESVDGPSYNGLGAYDGLATGWYKFGQGPDTQGGTSSEGTGTGTGDGTGTGTGDDSGSGSGSGSGESGSQQGSEGSGTEQGSEGGQSGTEQGSGGEGSGEGSGSEQNPQGGEGSGTEQDPEGGQSGTEQGSEPGEQGSGTGEHESEGGASGEQSTAVQRIKITSLTLKKAKYDYTGKRVRPAAVVRAGKRMLKKGTDYTVKYINNKAVGKARITVTGKGRYKGKLSRTFRIIPDRVKVKAKSYRIVEGTQIIVSLSSKSKPAYYEFQIAKDKKFRKIIARKRFTRKQLLSRKIYAYKHLKKGRAFYIRIRLIKSGLKGRYSKTTVIKGRG